MVRVGLAWLALGSYLLPGGSAGEEIRYVGSREVVLECAAGNEVPVETVELWVSRDGGGTWEQAPSERLGQHSIRYQAPEDGWFGFYLVLRNSAGASNDPPVPGSEPHVRVIVDTTPPVLQLHPGSGPLEATAGRPLGLRLSLVDEHLGTAGVRVFFRKRGSNPWRDGGLAAVHGTRLTWTVPDNLAGPIDLRVTATDRAGNRAIDELTGILIHPEPEPTQASAKAAPTTRPAVAATPPATPSVELPGQKSPDPQQTKTLEHLRKLAQRYLVTGRYPQAAARLEDALALAPADADLLVDLGSALYWAKRYDEADRRFAEALKLVPEHAGALEGLALVAATQKRYAHASEYLRQLLRLRPDSAETWLHLGDVEHQRGHRQAALEAWEHVLDLDHAAEDIRAKAQRRLNYFGPVTRKQP